MVDGFLKMNKQKEIKKLYDKMVFNYGKCDLCVEQLELCITEGPFRMASKIQIQIRKQFDPEYDIYER